jgi:hypothetical protein
MKRHRSGFGYSPAPKARAAEIKARSGAAERLDSIERQRAEGEESALPDALEKPKPDTRSIAERIGLQPGMDLDAELDRRRTAIIANPASDAYKASTNYAELCGEKYGWKENNTIYQYALFLRSVDLPKPRPTMIPLVDTRAKQRVNVQVTTAGPGAPPDGFAIFEPSRIDPWLVLGLKPPGLQPTSTPTFSPLTQAPPQMLTAQQRLEAIHRMQAAYRELERDGFLEWQIHESRGFLKV